MQDQYESVIQTKSWEDYRPVYWQARDIINVKGYTGELLTDKEASVLWSYIMDAPDQERDEPVDDQELCYQMIFRYDRAHHPQDMAKEAEMKYSYEARDTRLNKHFREIQRQIKHEQIAHKQQMEALITHCSVCKKVLTGDEQFLGYCQEHLPDLDEMVF